MLDWAERRSLRSEPLAMMDPENTQDTPHGDVASVMSSGDHTSHALRESIRSPDGTVMSPTETTRLPFLTPVAELTTAFAVIGATGRQDRPRDAPTAPRLRPSTHWPPQRRPL